MALHLDQYADAFMSKSIDGPQLLAVDNAKIKVRTLGCVLVPSYVYTV